MKQGIDRIEGQRITFNDGVTEDFDTLIAATGYLIDIDFMDKRVIEPRDNGLDLYMRIVPPDWAGVYFLAFFNSDTALNWICEAQIRWIREFELGRARLPSRADMLAEIESRKAAVKKHFKETSRHGIEVEHLPYFADLRRSMRDAHNRTGQPATDIGIGAENRLPPRVAADREAAE